MTKHSIAHFSGHEQQALHTIKNLIVDQLKPLMIFYIKSRYQSCLERSTFSNMQKEDTRNYAVWLLLIQQDDAAINNVRNLLLNEALPDGYNVHTIHYTLSQVTAYLKTYSLFFCWLLRFGILLHQREGALEKLPVPTISKRQYASQVRGWLQSFPDLVDGIDIKLNPVPVRHHYYHQSPCKNENRLIRINGRGHLTISFNDFPRGTIT